MVRVRERGDEEERDARDREMETRMQQGSEFWDFRFWDEVTKRREKVKRGGADHVPDTLRGKEELNWFFYFFCWTGLFIFFLSIRPNNKRAFALSLSPFSPIFISWYFRHLFPTFSCIFPHLFKTYKTK